VEEQGCRRALFRLIVDVLGWPEALAKTGPRGCAATSEEQGERKDAFLGYFLFD